MNSSEIKELRDSFGENQTQFAFRCGLTNYVYISSLERGERRPTGALLRVLEAIRDGWRPPLEDLTPLPAAGESRAKKPGRPKKPRPAPEAEGR